MELIVLPGSHPRAPGYIENRAQPGARGSQLSSPCVASKGGHDSGPFGIDSDSFTKFWFRFRFRFRFRFHFFLKGIDSDSTTNFWFRFRFHSFWKGIDSDSDSTITLWFRFRFRFHVEKLCHVSKLKLQALKHRHILPIELVLGSILWCILNVWML